MESDVMEKLAYSIEELSEFSTLSVPKIRKDIRNGKLESKKKGSRRIILRDEAREEATATPKREEDCSDFCNNSLHF